MDDYQTLLAIDSILDRLSTIKWAMFGMIRREDVRKYDPIEYKKSDLTALLKAITETETELMNMRKCLVLYNAPPED